MYEETISGKQCEYFFQFLERNVQMIDYDNYVVWSLSRGVFSTDAMGALAPANLVKYAISSRNF